MPDNGHYKENQVNSKKIFMYYLRKLLTNLTTTRRQYLPNTYW